MPRTHVSESAEICILYQKLYNSDKEFRYFFLQRKKGKGVDCKEDIQLGWRDKERSMQGTEAPPIYRMPNSTPFLQILFMHFPYGASQPDVLETCLHIP